MNCPGSDENLALFISGDLDPDEAAVLAEHLGECRSCRGKAEAFRSSRETSHSLSEEEFEESELESIRENVLARIRTDAARRTMLGGWLRPWPMAAAVMAAVALGVWWIHEMPAVHLPPHPGIEAVVPDTPVSNPPEAFKPKAVDNRPAKPAVPHRLAVHRSKSREVPAPPVQAPAEKSDQPRPDDIAIKLETSDPNVIIIWLASSNGGERR